MALYGINQIGGPNPGGDANALPTSPNLLIGDAGLAASLYGEIGSEAQMKGQVNALNIQAQGDQAEANQYNISADIAAGNAQLALVGGDIEKYQTMRQVQKTIGTQRATGAASGFADAGSALDVARSSLQQGLLQTQLVGTNADLKAGGYLEQASSAKAEAAAANAAGGYASAQAAAAGNQANIMGQNINLMKNLISGLPGGQALLPGANGKPAVLNNGDNGSGYAGYVAGTNPNYQPVFNGTRWV